MTHKRFLALLIAAALCMPGCATMTHTSRQVMKIDTVPTGAQVSTSIGFQGQSPLEFKTKRRGNFIVNIEKEGYEPVAVQVTSHTNGGAVVSGLIGDTIFSALIIGLAVDAGTGAMKELRPNPIVVNLVPVCPAAK